MKSTHRNRRYNHHPVLFDAFVDAISFSFFFQLVKKINRTNLNICMVTHAIEKKNECDASLCNAYR